MSTFKIITRGHLWYCPVLKRYTDVHAHECVFCELRGYGILSVFAFLLGALEYYGFRVSDVMVLQSDVWHVLGDGLTYLTSFVGILFASVVGDARKTAAIRWWLTFAVAALLIGSGGHLLSEGWNRFSGSPYRIEAGALVFGIGLSGFLGNLLMLWMLRAFDIGHTHHDDHYLRSRNLLRQANIRHTVGDLFSSLLVAVVTAVAWGFPGWTFLWAFDLTGSAFIAGYLVVQGFGIIRENHAMP